MKRYENEWRLSSLYCVTKIKQSNVTTNYYKVEVLYAVKH